MRHPTDKEPAPAPSSAVRQAKSRDSASRADPAITAEHQEASRSDGHDLSRFAVDREPRVSQSNLPAQLKDGVERLSGMSMDHVTVHYDSPQPAKLGAHAFAQGSDIHIGPGKTEHLAHEAWHVVQQAQGRVRPTGRTQGGVAINDDKTLESEADRMGRRALDIGRTRGSRAATSAKIPSAAALQPKRSGSPAQRVTKIIGGSELSWEPAVGVKLARYAEASEVTGKKYTGRGDNKAVWLADPSKSYDFSASAERPYLVTLAAGWTVANAATIWMNFESADFKGEAQHKNKIIVKENEKGAYGIGKDVAKNLFSSMTVAANPAYKPPGGSKKKKKK